MTICATSDCSASARVVVRDLAGVEAPMCEEHWLEILIRSGGLIRAVRFVNTVEADGAR